MKTQEIPMHCNVRSARYFIARAPSCCWHCGSATTVLALALPPHHEDFITDGGPADNDGAPHGEGQMKWQGVDANAVLFYIEYLPQNVARRLAQATPSFRLSYSAATSNHYWENHCDHCRALLGDHELHCEPEGAFCPADEREGAKIELQAIEEAFAASVAGYTLEPEFFGFLR